MRLVRCVVALVAGLGAPNPLPAAPGGALAPVKLACSGPALDALRKIAAREKLPMAQNPQACLASASMYGGSSKQIVVAAPAPACGTRKAIQIYERANSGTWGNILEKPVCGASVAFGPNNPWGAIMITIDGRHYDQRGAYYTLVKY